MNSDELLQDFLDLMKKKLNGILDTHSEPPYVVDSRSKGKIIIYLRHIDASKWKNNVKEFVYRAVNNYLPELKDIIINYETKVINYRIAIIFYLKTEVKESMSLLKQDPIQLVEGLLNQEDSKYPPSIGHKVLKQLVTKFKKGLPLERELLDYVHDRPAFGRGILSKAPFKAKIEGYTFEYDPISKEVTFQNE